VRVLLINHFPLVGSGSGTYTRNIAVHLIKMGHEVGIVMPENTAEYAGVSGAKIFPVFFTNDEKIANALPFNFPCFTTHPRSVKTFFDLSQEELEAYLFAFERAIGEAVSVFTPDIIHAQHIWLLSWLSAKTGIPYLITAHGTDLMGYQQGARFRKYADEAAAGAKRLITISNDNDELVREFFPSCADKAVIMRNGYDSDQFFPEPVPKEMLSQMYNIRLNDKLVFFAGKLANFKGIDVLLDAAKLYESKHPGKISTVIAGAGELSDKLKSQACKLGLESVSFVGHIGVSQLRSFFSSADVSVVPSRREPFGLVAIEALACGCPVIATNQGGLMDIITDEIGALVDVEDEIGLSDAIQSELFNPDRKQRGEAAAKYARDNYTQDSLIDSLVEIYSL